MSDQTRSLVELVLNELARNGLEVVIVDEQTTLKGDRSKIPPLDCTRMITALKALKPWVIEYMEDKKGTE